MTGVDPVADLAAGVRAGVRAELARAVTLVESRRRDHRAQAGRLLAELEPYAGGAVRVGVSGVPGVGKSTLIDQLGRDLINDGHRVAVLAVDPSSARSRGSILGDRTRMGLLAAEQNAFVRPSPAAGTLGGVAAATRETMLIMEAAGYDVVLVETVGVGQSEYAVADMVDTFLFLTLARTGDQLQGMKRGILELADVVAVNKADEERETESERAGRELSSALRFVRGTATAWQPPVVTCSALHDVGLDRVWEQVRAHRDWLTSQGGLDAKRREQRVSWTRTLVRDRMLDRLGTPDVARARDEAEDLVRLGELSPDEAAGRILEAVDGSGTAQ